MCNYRQKKKRVKQKGKADRHKPAKISICNFLFYPVLPHTAGITKKVGGRKGTTKKLFIGGVLGSE